MATAQAAPVAQQPANPAPAADTSKGAAETKVSVAALETNIDKNAKEVAKLIEEKKKLSDELDKIKENLTKSKTALTSEEKQVESISSLLKNEEDPEAKAKLMSAKDAAVKKVSDLRSHIVLGEKLV